MEYKEVTETIIGCAYRVHPVKWNFCNIKGNTGALEGINTSQLEPRHIA